MVSHELGLFGSRALRVFPRTCAVIMSCAVGAANAGYVVAEGHRVDVASDGQITLAAAGSGEFHPGWYLGLGVGVSDLDPDGGTSGWQVPDSDADGGQIFIGRHISPRLRAEFSYTDLGSVGLTNSNAAINAAIPNAEIDYSAIGLNLDWLVRPVNHPFNLFGRVGITSIDNSVNDSAILFDRDDDITLSAGVGVQWRGAGRWLARLTYERMASDVDWLGFTVGAYLGHPVGAAALDQAGSVDADSVADDSATTAVAATPTYTCKVIKRAVPGVDFASGSADLNGAAQNLLTRVGGALANAPDILVEVVGHTDSQGAAEYNQALSEKRAMSVRDFLAAVPGVMTELSARGAGESEPVADNNTAEGRKQNRRIELVFDNRLVCKN